MSTADSWTDRPRPGFSGETQLGRRLWSFRGAFRDLAALLAFRSAMLRGGARRAAKIALGVLLLSTVAAAWIPAHLSERAHRTDVLVLLPSAMVGVLVVSVLSAAASGGGRELLPAEQGVAFPMSATPDHLGALVMAPLNIAWILQAWTVLGATAYVAGPSTSLPLGQLVVVLWLVTATALGQVVGWTVEWLRRGPRGVGVVRGALAVAAAAGASVVASGQLAAVLERSPTVGVTVAALDGARSGLSPHWWQVVIELLVVLVVAVVAGSVMARLALRRPARDSLRLESSRHVARPDPRSDLAALVRTDRVGIWRSVPLRRGMAVLALMPGLVAVAGGLQWEMLTILPGLVASGGALLFGVNSWCLDGRGALWRDSLPVVPGLVFVSRVLVLSEVLLVATAGTVVIASLRAGLPTLSELAAVTCGALVVVVQVVSASLRWSVRRPYPVDLRSARATPAPPLVMVGYSSRLALSTTFVGLFFSVLSRVGPEWSVACALPLLLLSGWRLARTARAWQDPVTRCAVVTTVAS